MKIEVCIQALFSQADISIPYTVPGGLRITSFFGAHSTVISYSRLFVLVYIMKWDPLKAKPDFKRHDPKDPVWK